MEPNTRAHPSLTPEQRRRIRGLFDAALDHEPAERDAFIAGACGDDSLLLEEMRGLLKAHASAASWLDHPLLAPRPDTATEAVPSTPLEGQQIGPYQIQRLLGAGGMGSVYLAERAIGKVRQPVALKIIRPVLLASAEMVLRFEREREILASLDHADIARLLDAGSTTDGIPYLVMDYVQGEPLDAWCDARRLGITERLKLFCRVCAAIQYAHDHDVIHRDLKPGNMLITAEGGLKLLDFGIAKVLTATGDTMSLATRTGAGLMTIAYASPEQIRGEPVGPQTDVYSLGVVLYELLTGCRPYRVEAQMVHALARAICEEEPVTPSEAAAEAGAGVTAARSEASQSLRRRLSGDLDCIVLKALRKQPQWRYASPALLSEDILRHLAGQRVQARRDTVRYRIERLVHHLLYPSETVFHTHGMIMWTAGLLGALLLFERHQILTGAKARPAIVLDSMILGAWILWSIWERRRMERAGRFSPMDRLSWSTFTVIAVVAGSVTVVATVRSSLPPEALAVLWTAGLSIGLLAVGLQASRLMTAGGVALLLSAILAMLYPASVYLWLLAGMVLGMIVPGLVFIVQGASWNPFARRHQSESDARPASRV